MRIKIKTFSGEEFELFAEFGEVFFVENSRKYLVGVLGAQWKGFKPIIKMTTGLEAETCLTRGDHQAPAVYATSPARAEAIVAAFNKKECK